MHVLVPFDATDPKRRLRDALSADERRALAGAMLADVLDSLRGVGARPTVLATESLPADALPDVLGDVPVAVDDRALSACVNDRLGARADSGSDPTAVVMADLALATPDALTRLFAEESDVTLAPGRGGGTNALVVRHPDFRVDFHGTSYLDHLAAARDVGASVGEIDSFRLATDVDEPADLTEVLVHTDGRAADWLADAGFRLAVTDGRVRVRREE